MFDVMPTAWKLCLDYDEFWTFVRNSEHIFETRENVHVFINVFWTLNMLSGCIGWPCVGYAEIFVIHVRAIRGVFIKQLNGISQLQHVDKAQSIAKKHPLTIVGLALMRLVCHKQVQLFHTFRRKIVALCKTFSKPLQWVLSVIWYDSIMAANVEIFGSDDDDLEMARRK